MLIELSILPPSISIKSRFGVGSAKLPAAKSGTGRFFRLLGIVNGLLGNTANSSGPVPTS